MTSFLLHHAQRLSWSGLTKSGSYLEKAWEKKQTVSMLIKRIQSTRFLFFFQIIFILCIPQTWIMAWDKLSQFIQYWHDTVMKSMKKFWHYYFLRYLDSKTQDTPIFTTLELSCLCTLSLSLFLSLSVAHPPFILLFGNREPNKCSPAVTGGLEQPILFNEVIQCVFSQLFPGLCFSVCFLANYTVSCPASCPLFFCLHIFPPSF